MRSAYDNDPRVAKINDRLFRLPSPEDWAVQLDDGYWRGHNNYGPAVSLGEKDSPDPVIEYIIGPPK